jgi:hypothetical protein
MNKAMRRELYRRFSRSMVCAVTGHGRVGVTIVVYSVFALLLLGYVSAQIYAGMLRQEIMVLKQQRVDSKEAFNKLTARYVSASSRARVSDYCETKLGMVRVGGEDFEVLAVGDEPEYAKPVELTRRPEAIPSAQRYTSRRTDQNPGQ